MAKAKGATIKATDMVDGPGENLLSSLDLPTLHNVADYFGVEQEETIMEQVATLTENGVTYGLYAKEFKVPLPEDYSEEEELEELEDEINKADEDAVQEEYPVTVPRSAALQPQAEYLVKMTRANPYFEVASLVDRRKTFKFTQEHPYNIMDARTAQNVLENETGFRQAFPDELREFYQD